MHLPFQIIEEQHINPWGLHIPIFINVKEPNDTFKSKWETNLQNCTNTMMILLREHHGRDLLEVNKDLTEQSEKIMKFKRSEIFEKSG